MQSYRQYYADRWQCADLAVEQPLLVASRVPRQQLAHGLGGVGARKRASLGLKLYGELPPAAWIYVASCLFG